MAMSDVTVMGAGIFGLSVAWCCARRGARVCVVDPYRPGAGASGGFVGALAPHTPDMWDEKKEFQLQSLIMAEGFWAEVDLVSGLSSGFRRVGRLQSIADERTLALAYAREDSAQKLWCGHAEWRVISAETANTWANGWVPESATGCLIHDTLSARINPRAALASLTAAIRARGGEVTTGAPEPKGCVLWAIGYQGLLALSRTLGKPVGSGVKGQSALLAFDARTMPQLFADGLHVVAHEDGTTAVGSTSEREFDAPDTLDSQLDRLLLRAESVLPVLRDARILERWAGVRPRAKSRAPMLGSDPTRAGHFIANGGFKIGFGMAPKVGEAMADLMLDGIDNIPASFRVEASL
ncbi:MAG: NAD(P)/FAD-dependent oxidoreductase [Halocynthiibacter sp.]